MYIHLECSFTYHRTGKERNFNQTGVPLVHMDATGPKCAAPRRIVSCRNSSPEGRVASPLPWRARRCRTRAIRLIQRIIDEREEEQYHAAQRTSARIDAKPSLRVFYGLPLLRRGNSSSEPSRAEPAREEQGSPPYLRGSSSLNHLRRPRIVPGPSRRWLGREPLPGAAPCGFAIGQAPAPGKHEWRCPLNARADRLYSYTLPSGLLFARGTGHCGTTHPSTTRTTTTFKPRWGRSGRPGFVPSRNRCWSQFAEERDIGSVHLHECGMDR